MISGLPDTKDAISYRNIIPIIHFGYPKQLSTQECGFKVEIFYADFGQGVFLNIDKMGSFTKNFDNFNYRYKNLKSKCNFLMAVLNFQSLIFEFFVSVRLFLFFLQLF